MLMNLERKKSIVAEVMTTAESATTLVTADYRGLTVSQMTELRAKARAMGVKLRIVRNTLARRAFAGTPLEVLNESLVGPTLIAFTAADPGESARLLRDFAKNNEQLKVKALFLEGRLYPGAELANIAKLPTREEALAKLVGMMQAPITKFVRTIAAPTTQLVRLLAAIRDQGGR